MLKFCVGIVTDPLFGVASAATGFLFGHWFAQRRNLQAIRITEFNKGATEFRVAFVDIIYAIRDSGLQPGNIGWFDFMKRQRTNEVDIAHEKAKILFEPYLTPSELKGFNTAWETYYDWRSHFKDENDPNYKVPDFLGHINILLKYAKPKI